VPIEVGRPPAPAGWCLEGSILLFAGSPLLEGPAPFRFYAAWLFAGLDLEASRPSLD